MPNPRNLLPATPAPSQAVRRLDEKVQEAQTGLPDVKEMWNLQTPQTPNRFSPSYPWPRAGPLSILVENNQDVDAQVDVYGGMSADPSRRTTNPIQSYTVGARSSEIFCMNPSNGDRWAPYVAAVAFSINKPSGGAVRIVFARVGA